jgi:glutathione S-transferase
MKFYYFPGSCALGIHALLEEIGAPYEPVLVDLRAGKQHSPEYLAINPKAKVPVLLRDNGHVLTEWPAIALYLARLHPDAVLLPADPDDEADAMSLVEFVVSTVHMQAAARYFRPNRFAVREDDHAEIQARGKQMFLDHLATIDKGLAGREFAVGNRFSVADAAVLFVSFWASRGEMPMGANLAAHYARMKQRGAVQRAFKQEGLPL